MNVSCPELAVNVIVALATGTPAASRSTLVQAAGDVAAAHSDRKRRITAPSRRIRERMTWELYRGGKLTRSYLRWSSIDFYLPGIAFGASIRNYAIRLEARPQRGTHGHRIDT